MAVVFALRSYDDALDPAAEQVGHEACLALGIAAGVDEHDRQAVLLCDLADTEGQLRVKRVGQVADDQARRLRLPRPMRRLRAVSFRRTELG